MERKPRQKWDIVKMREFYKEHGCTLLATRYEGLSVKMPFICKCGDEYSNTFDSFRQNKQCVNCGNKAKNANRNATWKYNEVVNFYKEQGCLLLTTEDKFIGIKTDCEFICKCGNKYISKFNSFQIAKRCVSCGINSRANKRRIWSIDTVREYFTKEGCTLLSTEFNNTTPLIYICRCGGKGATLLTHFKNGTRCLKCRTERTRETCMEKYGVKCPTMTNDVKEKIKQSVLGKYGVENPFQSEEIKNKIKQNNLVKHGVEYNSQREDVKALMVETNIKKYGVSHPMQDPLMRDKMTKAAYKMKEIIGPNGKVFQYQGYEGVIIKKLIADGIKENDLFTETELNENNQMPEFWYEFDNKKHRYYPDLFIKSQNRFVEIKSEYTMNINPEKVLAKADCVFYADYKMDIYVLNEKKEIVNIISY
ncbi:Putative Vsr/MutH/archaeal HJR family nuclease [Pacmanvirus A23]|uniref:homing endonuclease n=1 Tax=Pacmanvirus A23 TaxID=1932881 RepID=UPI000A09195F|nr:homing endonuclease [Pacmanvirus A23]SIP86102.1 Putative Vsr/MutH/archaeal HJR family nuclease [Pacmanvirus A23]